MGKRATEVAFSVFFLLLLWLIVDFFPKILDSVLCTEADDDILDATSDDDNAAAAAAEDKVVAQNLE